MQGQPLNRGADWIQRDMIICHYYTELTMGRDGQYETCSCWYALITNYRKVASTSGCHHEIVKNDYVGTRQDLIPEQKYQCTYYSRT